MTDPILDPANYDERGVLVLAEQIDDEHLDEMERHNIGILSIPSKLLPGTRYEWHLYESQIAFIAEQSKRCEEMFGEDAARAFAYRKACDFAGRPGVVSSPQGMPPGYGLGDLAKKGGV